jgi:glycosyltransferase involved in cell wall biosynthesis
MRVAIDAVPLLVRSAGVKNYLYYWTRHLVEAAGGGVKVDLFPWLRHPEGLDHEGSAAGRMGTLARLGALHLLNQFTNDIIGQLSPDMDLFHTCKLLNPPRGAKLTATVHDLTCWVLPETHPPGNVAADFRFAERILKRADGLIAVSEATRQDAVRILGIPEERIRVIHHGVAAPFFEVTAAEAEGVKARLGLLHPYVLFVGTVEPRKNLDLLLDAYLGLGAGVR